MQRIKVIYLVIINILIIGTTLGQNSKHPCVSLTGDAVFEIRKEIGNLPLLDRSYNKLKNKIDKEIIAGIDVPLPKDPAGGYTHNKHKQNYSVMHGAGILWQLTEDKAYAEYVKIMLLDYAEMYPDLNLHPVKKSYAPGKLFWQSLNEAVWMVYTSQAYDCIYNYLSPKERKKIENDLLIPYANFLSVETPHVFNRIHNHGVWAVAAVGMVGFATENNELIDRAFKGVKGKKDKSGLEPGFYSQLDNLFSPDGYFTEGPYYQRYAILPYMLFAQAIENNQADRKIFEYRNNILVKALHATLQLTDSKGRFLPINDAIKSMSYSAPELINAVDIIYAQNPKDKSLLTIAKDQGRIILSGAGLKVAKDLHAKNEKPFKKKSIEFTDGANGTKGGLGILRAKNNKNEFSLIMKYASHGMAHGHFDRLSIMFYDNGNEILQDYGASRYVNVVHKEGGRYLSENKTWSKQTIAHNTVIVDSSSQYQANIKEAEKYNGEKRYFNIENSDFQIMSAEELNAYPGVDLQRTVALLDDKELSESLIIIDIFKINSKDIHTYDIPFYYQGQIININCPVNTFTDKREKVGSKFGYQHLWKTAQCDTLPANFKLIFLNKNRFYSIISESNYNSQAVFTEIGASDPNFNLRNEPGFFIRQNNAKDYIFFSVIESHGKINPNTELSSNTSGSVKSIKTLYTDENYTLSEINFTNNKTIILALSDTDESPEKQHILNYKETEYKWEGAYKLFKK